MSRRATPTADRPALERRRRGPVQFLREEWSLLGLAAVLTIMTWYITRLDVEHEYDLKDMVLDLKVVSPDEYVALVPDAARKTTIELYCSQSEFDEAKDQMSQQDNKITVFVDASVSDSVALSPSNCTFRYPFRESYLKNDEEEAIPGWLYKIEEQTITIEQPKFAGEPGTGEVPDIDFKPAPVTLKAPRSVVDTSKAIPPDPINLASLLAERKGRDVITQPLTFKEWVRNAPNDAARLFREKRIKPLLNFTATLRFVRIETRKIRNRAIYDVQNAEWYTFKVSKRSDVGLNLDPPDFATLPIKAPESLLRALEDPEGQKGWAWAIQIVGDLPAEGESKPMRANLEFMPIEERFRDPRIEYTAPKDSKGFEVVVERPKRGP